MFSGWLKLIMPLILKYAEEMLSPHKEGDKSSTALERVLILFAIISLIFGAMMFDKIYELHGNNNKLSAELTAQVKITETQEEEILELSGELMSVRRKLTECRVSSNSVTTKTTPYDKSSITLSRCEDLMEIKLDKYIKKALSGGG